MSIQCLTLIINLFRRHTICLFLFTKKHIPYSVAGISIYYTYSVHVSHVSQASSLTTTHSTRRPSHMVKSDHFYCQHITITLAFKSLPLTLSVLVAWHSKPYQHLYHHLYTLQISVYLNIAHEICAFCFLHFYFKQNFLQRSTRCKIFIKQNYVFNHWNTEFSIILRSMYNISV